MASTDHGRRLTEAHRLAQQQVRAEFLTRFLALWPLLDSTRLDETSPGWTQAVLNEITASRLDSARVATQYFEEFSAAEAPSTPRRARIEIPDLPASSRRTARVTVPDIDWKPADRAARVSLNVTGPASQKSKARRGKPLQVARDESFSESAGAASRHVLTGGRQSLLRLTQEDMLLVGYIRVTDGDPCYFCAMLASRGPVYRTPRRAGPNVRGTQNPRAGLPFEGLGEFKVHDNCACTVEPVYTTDTVWPGRAREFQSLWNDHIRNRYSGEDAVRAWRRLYEQQQRDAQRGVA
jgi:hypothetical protein